MKLICMLHEGKPHVASVSGPEYCILDSKNGWPTDIPGVLENWRFLEQSNQGGAESRLLSTETALLPPLCRMEKIMCIGVNYAEHAREMGGQPPEMPVVFSKFPSAVVGHGEAIRIPSNSRQVDFEAELVVMIGKTGKHIPRDSAMEYVLGYCCGNDVTARDWQKGTPGKQWLRGKTFDTFAPLGPIFVTRDEVANPQDLEIESRVNGQVMQHSNTRHQIFPIDELISHLSDFVTLKPGDLLFTGTPPGVGAGRDPQVFLRPGDVVEVEIEGLGVLRNPVVADA